MRAGSLAIPSTSMAAPSSEVASLPQDRLLSGITNPKLTLRDRRHEQQANQDSGAGSSDHHHADERPGHGYRGWQTHRRYPRGPDPEGGGLSRGAIHSAQGHRYDATATDRAPDVLSVQGRVRLFQHSGRR